MRFVVAGLRSKLEAGSTMASIAPAVGMLVAGDSRPAIGIDQTTSRSLELATWALSPQMCGDQDAGTLDAGQLRLLIAVDRCCP
jgi:hypothetical protein